MSLVKNFQITARLAEFGEFEQVDSPELDITIDDYFPPGARLPVKVFSIGKFSDISVARVYDPTRDAVAEDWVHRCLAGLDGPRNLTIFILNDQNIVQASKTYAVVPQGVKPPAGKSGDGALAEFTIKLAVEARLP